MYKFYGLTNNCKVVQVHCIERERFICLLATNSIHKNALYKQEEGRQGSSSLKGNEDADEEEEEDAAEHNN